MNTVSQRIGLAGLALGLVVGLSVGAYLAQPGLGVAQPKGAGAVPNYTVVHTEGTNLIVTDNRTSTLYFYTIDADAKPGADLTLRATVDLSQVGEKTLKPKLLKKRAE
jgi:hypothetical protein